MKKLLCFVTAAIVLLAFCPTAFSGVNNFAGTWKNTNTKTRGITKLVISVKGRTATVHAWGKCRPRDCDWGKVRARYYKNNSLRAAYKTKIAKRSLVLTLKGKNMLKASVKTHYTDKSGRKDRKNTYTFKRAATPRKVQKSTLKPARTVAATGIRHQGTTSTSKRAATFNKVQKSTLKPARTAAATGTRPQGTTSTSKPAEKRMITVLYPKGGEELVAGKQYRIRWKSKGNFDKVDVTLFMEDFFMKAIGKPMGMIPVYRIARQVKNIGACNFRIPYKFTSRFGKRYFVMVGDGKLTGWGNYFSIYPLIDVAPTNIKVYSYEKKKKYAWILRTVAAVATGGASEALNNRAVAAVATGGASEAARQLASNRQVAAAASGGATEAIRWAVDKNRKITKKTRIKIKFDLTNYGTKILRQKFMTKVGVRLRPGNDELSSAGFSHDRIIPIMPGKLYHYEADIKPSDWNILAGKYSLELYTDPGEMLAEPAELRNNNKKTVDFEVGKLK
ncbi:MAG: hypothetical protein KJN62_03385 [Deltaproteobacteria bacterium]|nr:hypothetical protein [Deltaproteobacteria bacterium]